MYHIDYSITFHSPIRCTAAPVKKKTENGGGKATKRQVKKKSKSSDSDTDDIFSGKQAPVSVKEFYKTKITRFHIFMHSDWQTVGSSVRCIDFLILDSDSKLK